MITGQSLGEFEPLGYFGADSPSAFDNEDLHSWMPWTSTVRAASGELNNRIAALAADAANYRVSHYGSDMSKAPANLRAWIVAWDTFIKQWNEWDPSTFFVFNTSKRRDELLAFRARFNELLNAVAPMIGQTATVSAYQATQLQPPPSASTASAILGAAKWIGIGAIVIGGAYGASSLFRTVGAFAPRRTQS